MSCTALSITLSISTTSLFRFIDWLSIRAISKMFPVSSFNLLAFLIITDRYSSYDGVFNEILSNIANKQKYHNYSKTKRKNFVMKMHKSIYDSKHVKILKVSESHLGTAFSYMINRPDPVASLTDWLSIILMIENNISIISTLDPDIKKIVNDINEFNRITILDS